MASSFTSNLLLEKQATGENNATWGTVLNTAVIDHVDTAITEELSLSVAGSSDVTLTDAQMRNAVHEYTGTLTGNINLIVPARNKIYFVFNNTAGSFTLTVKTPSGTGITVTQGAKAILYCDATNVVNLSTNMSLDQIEFPAPLASDPTAAAGVGFVYSKDVSAKAELHYLDEDGNVVQITTGGFLMGISAGSINSLAIGAANTVLKSDGTDAAWGTIGPANLAADAVETAKILDANVTGDKLATNAVTNSKIGSGAVQRAELGTLTATEAGSISSGTVKEITLNSYSFFPMIHVSSNISGSYMAGNDTDGASADAPRFALGNVTGGSITYDVDHRYVQA